MKFESQPCDSPFPADYKGNTWRQAPWKAIFYLTLELLYLLSNKRFNILYKQSKAKKTFALLWEEITQKKKKKKIIFPLLQITFCWTYCSGNMLKGKALSGIS